VASNDASSPKPRPFVSLKGSETGRMSKAGKTVYKHKGEDISEKAIDVEADGKVYVIPTVINGKIYTPKAATSMFFNGQSKAINVIEKGDKSQEEITKQIKDRSVKLKKGGVVIKQKSIMLKGRGGSFKGTY
jgi:hypothetical protein